MRRPALLEEWLSMRALFFAHTGLQKLSRREREQVFGSQTEPEAEALKMLEMLQQASTGAFPYNP